VTPWAIDSRVSRDDSRWVENGKLTYDPTNQVKLQGSYVFPGIHLWLTADYSYYTGTTYTKKSECLLSNDDGDPLTDDCHAFPQAGIAKVRYFAEPRGSRRDDPYNELNGRVEWKPPIGKNGRLGLIVDAFNILNDLRITGHQDRDNGDFNHETSFNTGRRFRFGVRYEF
jgi:outer membrane receptor protein involved in Fe transport